MRHQCFIVIKRRGQTQSPMSQNKGEESLQKTDLSKSESLKECRDFPFQLKTKQAKTNKTMTNPWIKFTRLRLSERLQCPLAGGLPSSGQGVKQRPCLKINLEKQLELGGTVQVAHALGIKPYTTALSVI